MAHNRVPWVLWELGRSARRKWLYGWRCLAAAMAVYWVGVILAFDRTQSPSDFLVTLIVGGQLVSLILAIVVLRARRSLQATSLSAERRDGTLALLLCTPRRPIEVVLLKLVPTCAQYLAPVLAGLPAVVLYSATQGIPFSLALAAFLWVGALLILCSSLWVTLTCTRLSERNVAAVMMLIVMAFVFSGVPLGMAFAPAAGSFAWHAAHCLNPWQHARGTAPGGLYFWIAAALYLVAAALCVAFGCRMVTRAVYADRPAFSLWWVRLVRSLRRMLPWRAKAERWLLDRFPTCWLGVRNYPWIALPSVIALGSVAGIVVAAKASAPDPFEDVAPALLGCFGAVSFGILVQGRNVVSRTIKEEQETRMNELIVPLPMSPTQVVVSYLVAYAFWVGPSLAVVGSLAAVTALFVHWLGALFALLALIELLAISAVICLGSHLGARIPRRFTELGQWALGGIAIAILFSVPTSLMLSAIWTDHENLGWLFASFGRIAMDLVFALLLFRWLVKRVAVGAAG